MTTDNASHALPPRAGIVVPRHLLEQIEREVLQLGSVVPVEKKVRPVDPLHVDHRGRPIKMRAERPRTVTRGLSYIISPHLARLRRLHREWDKSSRWHSSVSRQMLDGQCESLYYRVYGSVCYYGPLPSGPDYSFLQ